MINQPEETARYLSGLPYSSPTRGKQSTDISSKGRAGAASRRSSTPQSGPGTSPSQCLKPSGGARRATIITRHDNARADYRVGDKVTFTSPRRTKAWRDREVQPEERQGTLRRDRLERLLWLTPQGGKGKREERCGEAERRRGNGEAVDGRAGAHGLDARVRRGQETPWRLSFPTPRDLDQPHPCPGGKRGADPGHRATRDRTRDRGDTRLAMDRCGKATARRIGATPRAKTYESQTS